MKKVKRFLGVAFPKGWTWIGLITTSILWGWFIVTLIMCIWD